MNAGGELWPAALKTLAALAIVAGALGVALALFRQWARRAAAPGGAPLLRVLASHPLGVKRSVLLLEVPGGVLVLGVTPERIQLLDRIRDPQLLERIGRGGREPAASFADQLTRILSRVTGGGHAA